MTDFGLSEDQNELREVLRRFLATKSPSTEVRRLMDTEEGFDAQIWRQMVDQLGLAGLAIPEEYGGSGYSYVEQAIVFEETGAALLCSPLFASVALAANALLASDDEAAKSEFLPAIAAGELTATLAFADDDDSWMSGTTTASASPRTDDSWSLDGAKSFVIDGYTAELILITANTDEGLSLFAVGGDADGLHRTPLPTMDQTRKQARLVFDSTPARIIGAPGSAAPVLDKTLQLAAVAIVAEATGGAQRCLDMASQYAKDRIQFSRPIGSFQAVKHMCSDLLIEVESARSAAYYAASLAAEGGEELASAVSLAKAYCTEAYFHAAAQNIQIHGGIGYTWEHDAHLYFKRAKTLELLLGDPSYHRDKVAALLGI